MKTIPRTVPARVHTALLLLLLTFALASASCKRSGVNGNANAGNSSGNSTAAGEISTTPPFSTKEPERYQARMVIQGSIGEGSNLPGMPEVRPPAEKLIARDGEKRRTDDELSWGMKVTYLQLASVHYTLLPEKKIYAEDKFYDIADAMSEPKSTSPDFSADKLVNQSNDGARYEQLGTEEINGRATMKYRITIVRYAGQDDSRTTVNLIWIDESLGMPIKSEITTTSSGTHIISKYSMELRDIKQEVDQSIFALPTDYKKVSYDELSREMTNSALNSTGTKK